MATYVIGDIHGCFDPLQRLLEQIGLEESDEIWTVGDLVNRGPSSLEVLRWANSFPARRLTVVLGNHDLHLLSRYYAGVEEKQSDTLDDILSAPDCDSLLDWLRRRPFLHASGHHVLVHAGFPPTWSYAELVAQACQIEAELSGPRFADLLSLISRRGAGGSSELEEIAEAARLMTRIRTCLPDGRPCLKFTGPPQQAPPGCRPWYERSPTSDERTILFGHWAALGFYSSNGVFCLDSGCVYGGALTVIRLEDHAVFQVACRGASDGPL